MIFKIKGGRNNKVFLFRKKKRKIIIKEYKSKYSTKYNRFLTEKIFLEFLQKKKFTMFQKLFFQMKRTK